MAEGHTTAPQRDDREPGERGDRERAWGSPAGAGAHDVAGHPAVQVAWLARAAANGAARRAAAALAGAARRDARRGRRALARREVVVDALGSAVEADGGLSAGA